MTQSVFCAVLLFLFVYNDLVVDLVEMDTIVMLGFVVEPYSTLNILKYHVGIKISRFFFNYSPGDDPIPIAEMPSTGKVVCICEDKYQAKYYFAFQNWMNLAITFSLPLVLLISFLNTTSLSRTLIP